MVAGAVLQGNSSTHIEQDAVICLEAETQTVYRAAEFPQFWLCDTELFPKGGSGGLGAGLVSADIEDGDYSLVSVSPQNVTAPSGAYGEGSDVG